MGSRGWEKNYPNTKNQTTMKNLQVNSAIFVLLISAVAVKAQIPEFTRIDTGTLVDEAVRGRGVYPVDFDNDGDLDLYIGNSTGLGGTNRPNLVYKNERNFQFTKIRNGILATKIYNTNPGNNWGDADNDGDWDLFNHGELYINDGFGNFEISPDLISSKKEVCGTWIDYNNDSYLDIFTNVFLDGNYMYKNNGDNTFSKVSIGPPTDNSIGISQSSSWSDCDNDGDLDFFEPNFLIFWEPSTPANNKLHINNNDGTFSEIDSHSPIVNDSLGATGGAWGDYDNDGDMDIYVFSVMVGETTNYLYRNMGNLNFERIIIEPDSTIKKFTYTGTWGDFNNDGFLDLFVGVVPAASVLQKHCTFKENLFFINNGDGTFSRKTTGSIIKDGAQALAANDFDNDGDLDLIITHGNLAPPYLTYIYANNGNDNNWMNFTCEGTHSNRSGIGTRISVKARIGENDVWMMRELTQENGLHSCNGARLHFGLGDAELADSVIIRWPSAHIDTFLNVTSNQFYTAIEDSVVELDLRVTNYIEYAPAIEVPLMFIGDSTTIDLADHFRFVMGDTIPEITGDTLQFLLIDEGDPDILIPNLEGTILTLKTGGTPGSSVLQVKVTTEGFMSRIDFIEIPVYDSVKQKVNTCSAEVSSFHDAETHYNHAIDGDMETRWGSDYSDNQWIKITLDTIHSVAKVVIYWEAASAKRYKILASKNDRKWDTVYYESSGDGETDIVFFEPVEAKYIQLLGIERNTQWGFSIWELEIYSTDIYNTECEPPTNIDSEKTPDDIICVYPNPSTDHVYIDFNQPLSGETVIEVLEYTGKPVLIERIYGNNLSVFEMDISTLKCGIYILKIINENKCVYKKIIKSL
jgi:hypothetical protein